MRVVFWGVRGSYPVPGPSTVRYGGQTSCVEIRSDARECLIVDAGTGLRALGHKLTKELNGEPGHFRILLSHVHWDHIQGLPFFEPAYIEGTKIEIYALRVAADELNQGVGRITRHECFPAPLDAVPAALQFHDVPPGETSEPGPSEAVAGNPRAFFGVIFRSTSTDRRSIRRLRTGPR